MWKTTAKLAAIVTTSSAFFIHRNNVFAKAEEPGKESPFFSAVKDRLNLSNAIPVSRDLVSRKKDEYHIPGIVAGVSWKGKNVWVEGFGFADIELGAKCNESTVMRIASISKCITMLLVGKLVEDGKLDLNESVYFYLKDKFPEKHWDGEKVDITVRQLASHTAGIRHYSRTKSDDNEYKPDTEMKEFYSKESFNSVFDALDIFKNDELIAKPGTKFKYTTHGYTLLSAVIEEVLPKGETFEKYLMKMCKDDLGMESTFLDEFEPIIYNRSKYYRKVGKEGKLMNAPYVDLSNKWAGGGLLSNVPDLLKFANVLLYSYIGSNNGSPGYLKRSTIETLWKPVENVKFNFHNNYSHWTLYGLGFSVIKEGKEKYASGASPPFENAVFHSGGAVGASSQLLIVPEHELVVAVICNSSNSPDLGKLAFSIAKNFVNNIVKADSDDSFIEL